MAGVNHKCTQKANKTGDFGKISQNALKKSLKISGRALQFVGRNDKIKETVVWCACGLAVRAAKLCQQFMN
ncbi:MAG: hypothetical protein Q4P20_08010 [Eubacteriales bacterium]|nr:hypothetical protein [Eubacteriales bacterium]